MTTLGRFMIGETVIKASLGQLQTSDNGARSPPWNWWRDNMSARQF
jgi:hypothetical protein